VSIELVDNMDILNMLITVIFLTCW